MDQSALPLDQFDNDEFDSLGDEGWLAITKKGMARYYINGAWRWRPCEVVDYDYESRKFTIKFRGSNKTKQVKRLNLMFEGESKERYEARVAAAEREREKAKAALRFDHYIANQDDATITPMMQKTLEAIHAKVIGGLVPAASPMNDDGTLNTMSPQAALMRKLTAAAIQDYARSMKKAVLYYTLKYEEDSMVRYSTLKLPIPSFDVEIPEFGKLQIPELAFEENRAHLTNSHYTSRLEVLDSLLWLHELWDNMLSTTKFVTTDQKKAFKIPCQLSHFRKAQEVHCAQTQDKLSVEWRRGISERLVDNVQDIYDFFESNMAVHTESPLARLLKAIEVRMQTELRSVVKDTVNTWVDFVEDHTITKQLVEAQSGEMRECSLPIAVCGTPALFEVTIVGDRGEVQFEPCLEDIESVFLGALDNLVAATRSFHRIDHELMSLLNLGEIPIFNLGANPPDPLVASADKHIADSRVRVSEMVTASFVEPLKLLDGYKKFAYLLTINPKDYTKAFFGGESYPSKGDIEQEVQKFTDATREINSLSHDTEHFRICVASCVGIKKALSAQASAIVSAILKETARWCKAKNNRITSEYKAMLDRIHEKPQNEVELQKLMDYIVANKITVANLIEEVNDIHAHMDVAAKYHYPLPKEEFDLAWSTKQWPREIQ
jgi:dynein heavy chain